MIPILEKPVVRQVVLPISVAQYHQLGQAGILAEDTELIRGVVIQKMVKSPLHSWLVQRLVKWLRDMLPSGFHVRQEQPLTLTDSEPEPDIAVVTGEADDYRKAHPTSAVLVIEVAVGSAGLDREKADIYASAGIAEYWIILSEEQCVEVHRGMTPDGYAEKRRVTKKEMLTPQSLPGCVLEPGRLFAEN